MRRRFLALPCALVVVASAHPVAASADDVDEGRRKAAACQTCHGPAGKAVLPGVPSLAAQPAMHTFMQLLQFREKRRVEAQMSPLAASLTDTDMQQLAAYFAAQPPPAPSFVADPAKAVAGRKAADARRCTSCHLGTLAGQNHVPRIAGQGYEYLVTQLRGFKAGSRSDIDSTMTMAAQPLSDQEIEDLAHYIASLP